MDLCNLQSNLNSSNTNGSFFMAELNSFLSPYEIHPVAQENKYLRKFSYFIMKKLCVLIRIIRVYSIYNYYVDDRKDFPKLSSFAS